MKNRPLTGILLPLYLVLALALSGCGTLRSAGYVNVRDFGAKGDGIADDAPAIQRAIDSLGEAGGRVSVPQGRYFIGMRGTYDVECPAPQNKLGYAISIPSGVTLTGDGPAATVFLARHHTEQKDQYSALVIKGSSDVIIEKIGVKFDDWRKLKVGERLIAGIDIRFSRNVTIRDCTVKWCGQGITCFFGNRDILIDGVKALNCAGCGVGIYSSVGRTVVANSLITDCSDGMLSSYGNSGETEFLNNRVQVTAENTRGDKCTQLITVEASQFVKVIGNHVKGGCPGIDVKRTKDTTILGNTLTECVDGITVRAGDHAGAAGYSWRTLIANNILENFRNPTGAGAMGIRVSAAVLATVQGNILSNIEGDNIQVTRYGEFRGTGHWPLSACGIVVANNLIIRRTEEYTDDPVKGNPASPEPTPVEKWNPLDPAQTAPPGLVNIAHRAIFVSEASDISITGNVVRGGGAATWPHAGGIVISGCDGFTLSGNSIGDGNQGRGLLVENSSGTVSGNNIEGATEYAVRIAGCRLTTVSANRIAYRAKDGVALDVEGNTEDCAFLGNVIHSDGKQE